MLPVVRFVYKAPVASAHIRRRGVGLAHSGVRETIARFGPVRNISAVVTVMELPAVKQTSGKALIAVVLKSRARMLRIRCSLACEEGD